MLILWPINHLFVDFDVCLGLLFLLEDPLAAKFQPPSRGNQIFGLNVLVLGKVDDAVDLNKGPRTSGNKIAP